MIRRVLLPVLLCLACAPAPAPRVTPPPPFQPHSMAQRVVFMTFDGLGADALGAQTGLPAFERLKSEGATARLIPVSPTHTSSTHVAMLTGADPQVTGIVANRFHLPGTPPERTAIGMETPSDVETLVEAARRQGKRVGVALFPTIDGRTPQRTADFGVIWSDPLAGPRAITLTRSDFRREWVPPTWTQRPRNRTSYSPVMRARLEWNVPQLVRKDVDLVAYDTTNDQTENYDTYLIESGDREIIPDGRGWFPLSVRNHDGTIGSWSKLLQKGPRLDVTLYWGSVSQTKAYPDHYAALLDEEAGFWPGEPDGDAGAELFIEQMDRLTEYLTRVQVATIRRMPFDLLLAYQPQIDEAGHSFLGKAGGEAVIRAAFVSADRALASLLAHLDPARDAVVVAGDHGLAVAQREVRLNRLLAEKGFFPRWRAYASGSAAHLYRFSGADDGAAVAAALEATGLFEKVERKGTTAHRNSGDLIAWGWPDVAVRGDSEGPAQGVPEPAGQHGALSSNRQLHSPFLAFGAGIPQRTWGEMPQTRIARFLSQLLGIEPPAAAE